MASLPQILYSLVSHLQMASILVRNISRAKLHWETPAGPEYRKALISYTLIRGWLSRGQTLNPK